LNRGRALWYVRELATPISTKRMFSNADKSDTEMMCPIPGKSKLQNVIRGNLRFTLIIMLYSTYQSSFKNEVKEWIVFCMHTGVLLEN